jgi:hypothetical protein
VVVRELPEIALPGWVDRLIRPVADGLAEPARRALALALGQPEAFGEVAPPAPDAPLIMRGAAFFASRTAPRLLGAEARAQAHGARLDAARRRLDAAEAAAREGDVHLAPYQYWNLTGEAQPALFDRPPDEPAAGDALCVVSQQPE